MLETASQAKVGNVFEFLGYAPDCDFIYHNVFDSEGFKTLPHRPDLPLLLWNAEEAFVEDTSGIH